VFGSLSSPPPHPPQPPHFSRQRFGALTLIVKLVTMNLSRRDFLKLGATALGSLAFGPFSGKLLEAEGSLIDLAGVGRITVKEVDYFVKPDVESEPAGKLHRDDLFAILEVISDPKGLANAPRWYRIFGGYINSAYVQRVEGRRINETVPWVPEEGVLGEITVPYTQSQRLTVTYGWVPLYRLYYQSVHWITGVDQGPDQNPWYKITDELLKVDYHVPAHHVRLVQPEELTPISPDVPWEDKKIEVSLKDQTLTAYERGKVVLHTLVSTGIPGIGKPGGRPSHTPGGNFNIEVKMPSKHMGDGDLTSNIHAYELPGVPWVSFFHESGVAFHGTFWHYNFGRKMSHGCVNMTIEDAQWLYRWSLPETESNIWEKRGFGTQVIVY
jgi:lipoprotein-anchoring transpeptidase ErfK/SrfK